MARTRALHYRNGIAHDKTLERYYVRVMKRGRILKAHFPTRKGALLYLERLALKEKGIIQEEPAPTVQEAYDGYLKNLVLLGRSSETADYYAKTLKTVLSAFGALPLDLISQADINTFVKNRKTEVSNGTINKVLKALVTLYHHADVKPGWKLPVLSHQPAQRRVYPPAIVAKLWKALEGPGRVAFGLCMFTAMRASEALAADSSWVDLENDEIRIPVKKTGTWNRTALVGSLKAVLPEGEGKLVRASEGQIRDQMLRASKAAGINPPIGGHGVGRHLAVTLAADAGFGPDKLRLLTSHASGTVLDRYLHSQVIGQKREMLQAIEQEILKH